MSDKKRKYEKEAKAFFSDKKNDNVSTVYVTSDGNLFRAEHYADNWKTQLKNRDVEVYHRHPEKAENTEQQTSGADPDDNEGTSGGGLQTGAEDVRAALVKEFIELFDTKPHHMMGVEKLTALIAEKKAELAKSGDSGGNIEKRVVTEEDLKNNPDLSLMGVKVGDELEINKF